jgi:hypothetical protein
VKYVCCSTLHFPPSFFTLKYVLCHYVTFLMFQTDFNVIYCIDIFTLIKIKLLYIVNGMRSYAQITILCKIVPCSSLLSVEWLMNTYIAFEAEPS